MKRDKFWYWFYGKLSYYFGELYDYFLTKELYVGAECRCCGYKDGMHRFDCKHRRHDES